MGDEPVDITIAETQLFNSIDEAKTAEISSTVLSYDDAATKVIDILNLTNVDDLYNYDPIANDDVATQAISSQLANLYIALPYLIEKIESSDTVINHIATFIFSSVSTDLSFDLSSQENLETIFNIDNTPNEEDGLAPDILKDIAEANKGISESDTIEGQVFSQLAIRDDLLQNRVVRDLKLSDLEIQYTNESEKFIGSLEDDDFVYAAGGDDIFGDGSSADSLNEGDIFIGGSGKDTAVIAGSESDYIFMLEAAGSMRYDVVEASLGLSLGNDKILVAQKTSDSSGLIFVQSEVVRFSDDASWFEFNQTTGQIEGGIFDDQFQGTSLVTDSFSGGYGNDTLNGFGGKSDSYDLLDGGQGDDIIIAEGGNTEARGGLGHDQFKVLGLDGSLLIQDFSSATTNNNDKIDLRAFNKGAEALTFEDILSATSNYSDGNTSGVKIDLSEWTLGESETSYSGSVIIKGANLTDENKLMNSNGEEIVAENFFLVSPIEEDALEGNTEGV